MKKHIKTYLNHFHNPDFVACEMCGRRAVDIHHIVYKSRGGTDDFENLIALCRHCHNLAHAERITINELKQNKKWN